MESYKILAPDSNSTTIYLAQQGIPQNFTVTSGPETSSTSPPSGLSRWAVLINVLWFASLLCSVAAASLAMLVQQWLREYLAVNHISPQSRVRLRVYRRSALQQWRVLEIAALLPPLLQIALGLFLVGMCYFTASVQHSLLCTSLPLVGGWAFFIFMSTIAPLFSARCPFKTPFLKSLMKLGRRHVTPWLCRPLRYVFASALFSSPNFVDFTKPAPEEEDIVNTDKSDASILIQLDEITLDDEVVAALCEAFKQTRSYPDDSVPFVMALIKNRLGPGNASYACDLTSIPDLQILSNRPWLAITDFIAETLSRQLNGPHIFAVDYPKPISDMISLLLSSSNHPLSGIGLRTLEECLELRYWRKLADVIAERQQEHFVPMAKSLVPIYMSPDSQMLPRRAMELYAKCLCRNKEHQHHGNTGLLSVLTSHEHTASRDTNYIKYFDQVTNDMWAVLLASLRSQVVYRDAKNLAFKDGSMEAFTIVWQFSRGTKWEDEVVELTRRMWLIEKQTRFIFYRAITMHRAYRVDTLCDILISAYVKSDISGESSLSYLHDVLLT